MATRLQDKTEQLAAKRQQLHDIFAAGGDDLNLNEEQVKDIQQRNDELAALGKEVEDLRALDQIDQRNKQAIAEAERLVRSVPHAGGASDQPAGAGLAEGGRHAVEGRVPAKSMGELFTESRAYKEYNPSNNKGPIAEVEGVQLKTLMTESAGFAPQAIRTGAVIPSAQQQPRIVDVIPSATTTQTAVVFMRETTYTNNAAETAEAGTYPEAALAYTEISMPVRKIAVFLPVTDEQLADVEGMQDRINNRLTLMMRQRLDQQIIAGDGNAPNLTGLLSTGSIQTQARGTDPNVDAVYKALTKLRAVGFVEPNAVLMHPNDWQDVRLLRTADGLYIYGAPSDPGMERLWGLPVVQSTYVTENTSIAADFAGFTELDYKAGLEFEISNSHSDYFVSGKLAIRCQLRCCLVVYRPSAICKVTGM